MLIKNISAVMTAIMISILCDVRLPNTAYTYNSLPIVVLSTTWELTSLASTAKAVSKAPNIKQPNMPKNAV